MSLNDPVSDLLSRLRNGQKARKTSITLPSSKFRNSILSALERAGYIAEVNDDSPEEKGNGQPQVKVTLRYFNGEPVIKQIDRVSSPGRRVYRGVSDIGKFYNGLGVYILSTPKGVMTDHEARAAHVGGEVLCQVF
jgi:small subunit ribosomal protein S8